MEKIYYERHAYESVYRRWETILSYISKNDDKVIHAFKG